MVDVSEEAQKLPRMAVAVVGLDGTEQTSIAMALLEHSTLPVVTTSNPPNPPLRIEHEAHPHVSSHQTATADDMNPSFLDQETGCPVGEDATPLFVDKRSGPLALPVDVKSVASYGSTFEDA